MNHFVAGLNYFVVKNGRSGAGVNALGDPVAAPALMANSA